MSFLKPRSPRIYISFGIPDHTTSPGDPNIQGSRLQNAIMGSVQPIEELDVLLVGAGFGAFTMLNK